VRESTLATVPSAVQAQTAQLAAKALSLNQFTFAPTVAAHVGQTVPVATFGPLTVSLRCLLDGDAVDFEVVGTTSVSGASFAVNGTNTATTAVGEEVDIADGGGVGMQASGQVSFSALTPDGRLWQGLGIARSGVGGSTDCAAQLVLFG
jgi:hypothetical protein